MGLVVDALVQHAILQNPEIGIQTSSVNVIVGETNDGFLNDLQGRHVRAAHVRAAIETASQGPVSEGAVGAGTGTRCLGWKGGIGTASRILPDQLGGFCLGALIQSNFGRAQDLIILGVPVGRFLLPPVPTDYDQGSAMVVLATDAPLNSHQLQRLCLRVTSGMARTGSFFGNGSGDFVISFSTAWRIDHVPASPTRLQTILADEAIVMEGLFRAVVESVE